MKTYKQLLMGAACAVLILGALNVRAEDKPDTDTSEEFASKIGSGEKVVLFKIHDIKPVKSKSGVVTDCEFSLTFYNRSPQSIDEATLDLKWIDQGISSVIEEEKKEEKSEDLDVVKSLNQKSSQEKRIKTADVTDTSLKTSIILPQIKPFRQLSLRSQLKSDRCFLMMEDVEFSFSSCKIKDNEVKDVATVSSRRIMNSAASAASAAEIGRCQSLFRFVSPHDPEYYREFQKVSFNEESVKKSETRKKDIEEMDLYYDKMIKNLSSLTETLDNIK